MKLETLCLLIYAGLGVGALLGGVFTGHWKPFQHYVSLSVVLFFVVK